MPESFPTAELVARAIVGTSRRSGAIPLGVLSAFRLEEKQARLYALAALLELCPDVAPPAIGRAVGANLDRAYDVRAEVNTARSKSLWWIEDIVAETVAEIRAHYESGPSVKIAPQADRNDEQALVNAANIANALRTLAMSRSMPLT